IPNAVVSYQIDFEGDGIIDYTGPAFEDISHAYTTEGIYYPTVTVTDDQGNVFTDGMAITVLNKAKIDALLKSKWEGMKGALASKNIEGALTFFIPESRELYRQAFNLIIYYLPEIVSAMQRVELVYSKDKIAKYRIIRMQHIGGTPVEVTYYIYFVKDSRGVWRIDQF
ncbi:MAG: PKD domain-containing protein, partial [Thermodesulfovibrionales bacterium]